MTKILVFGIFDGIHPGHISFLRQAKRYGDFLIVAVGRDEAVKKLKNKPSKHTLRERLDMVGSIRYVSKAIPGDKEQGSYRVIQSEKPDIICLGYDQEELGDDLKRWLKEKNFSILLKTLKPYKHKEYHNSILTKA